MPAIVSSPTIVPSETSYFAAADRRAIVLPGVPADHTFTFKVRAYRRVDRDINPGGVIVSTEVATGTYTPTTAPAFLGDLQGTIQGRGSLEVVENLEAIASDGMLSTTEKPGVILAYNQGQSDWNSLHTKAQALGNVGTQDDAASAAWTSLSTYLSSLVPAWNDTTQHTPIVASTFQSKWASFYASIADLQAAISGQQGPKGDPGTNGTNGTNGLNNARVLLFQRGATAPTLPSAVTTYTFATGTLTGQNNGWTQAIPAANGQPLWVTAATASSATATDTIAAAEWASATTMAQDGAAGSSGTNGLNSATVFLYQRAATAPAVPSVTTTYTFATGILAAINNGWSQTVPSANGQPLYITTATALGSGATDTIATGEWAAPTVMAQDGATGASGLHNAQVFLYQRSAAAPAVPSVTTTYTFATGILTGQNNGWSTTIPAANGNPLYVTAAVASATTATDTINASEWATPVVMTQDGAAGSTGSAGINNATVFLYQRAATAPAVPSVTTTYTFATGVLSAINNGWSQTVPASNGLPCYHTTATALSSTATDTIGASEWAAPTILVQDGAAGLGQNFIINSDFSYVGNNTYGWSGSWAGNVTGGTTTWGCNLAGSPNWYGQLNVANTHVTNVANPGSVGQVFDSHYHLPDANVPQSLANLQRWALPVYDGDRVFASALLAAHRCQGSLFIQWYNGNGYASGFGGYVGGDTQGPYGGRNMGASNGDPANFDRLTLFATAPAGARYAVLRIRGLTAQASTDNDSWLFYTQMMLCKVPTTQTTIPPYSPGPGDRSATYGAVWGTNVTGVPTPLGAVGNFTVVDNGLLLAGDANRVRFSLMEKGTAGYQIYDNTSGAATTFTATVDPWKNYIHGSGSFTAASQYGSIGTVGAAVVSSPYRIPVTPGERIFFGCQVASGMPSSQCSTVLRLYFYDVNGAQAGAPYDVFNGFGSDPFWTRHAGFTVVPANAVFCSIVFYAENNASGGNGTWNLYLAEPMVCSAGSTQTVFPAFTPGPGSQFGADVTMGITGPAAITINADYTGAVTTAMPATQQYKLMASGVDVSASASWSVAVTTGTMAASMDASGNLSLNTTGAPATLTTGSVTITATYNGITAPPLVVKVTKVTAPAPSGGSGGGTSASGYVGATPTTTMAAMLPELDVTPGSGGAVTLSADLVFSATANCGCTVQWYRWNGTAWVAIGTSTGANYNKYGGDVEFSCQTSVGSLSGAQRFQLWGKVSTSSFNGNISGQIDAVGS